MGRRVDLFRHRSDILSDVLSLVIWFWAVFRIVSLLVSVLESILCSVVVYNIGRLVFVVALTTMKLLPSWRRQARKQHRIGVLINATISQWCAEGIWGAMVLTLP